VNEQFFGKKYSLWGGSTIALCHSRSSIRNATRTTPEERRRRRKPSSKNAVVKERPPHSTLLTVPSSQYLPHSTFLTVPSSQYPPHSTLLIVPSSQYPPQKRPFSPSLPRNVSSEHPQNRTHHNTLHIRSNVLAQYRQPDGASQPDGGSKSR
jgi:hypothetical protein